jgi:hypothetical protein
MDHEEQATQVERMIFQDMSAAQKYEQLLELRRFAWDLKAAAVRERHPEMSAEEIDRAVAEIFIHATT